MKYHRWLLDAFDKRTVSDYGSETAFTVADVESMLSQAREIVTIIEKQLLSKGYETKSQGNEKLETD